VKNHTKEVCVFFLTTAAEYEKLYLERAIDYYLNKLSKSECEYTFDLFIFFDQTPKKRLSSHLEAYESSKYVNTVKVISHEIPDEENLYERDLTRPFPLDELPMGRSHGINHHFYSTLDYLFETEYKSFLLLEHDTKPFKNDWLTPLIKHSETEDFKLAGSTYKGKNRKIHLESYYGGHLNGVGLYRNSKECKQLFNNGKEFLKKELISDLVKPKGNREPGTNPKYYEFMNYDVATFMYAEANDELCGYNDSDFFTNASAPEDENTSVKSLLKQYPNTLIMHHKKLY